MCNRAAVRCSAPPSLETLPYNNIVHAIVVNVIIIASSYGSAGAGETHRTVVGALLPIETLLLRHDDPSETRQARDATTDPLTHVLARFEMGTYVRVGLRDARVLEGPMSHVLPDGRLLFDDVADTAVDLRDITHVWEFSEVGHQGTGAGARIGGLLFGVLGAMYGYRPLCFYTCAEPSGGRALLGGAIGAAFGAGIGAMVGYAVSSPKYSWVERYPRDLQRRRRQSHW